MNLWYFSQRRYVLPNLDNKIQQSQRKCGIQEVIVLSKIWTNIKFPDRFSIALQITLYQEKKSIFFSVGLHWWFFWDLGLYWEYISFIMNDYRAIVKIFCLSEWKIKQCLFIVAPLQVFKGTFYLCVLQHLHISTLLSATATSNWSGGYHACIFVHWYM